MSGPKAEESATRGAGANAPAPDRAAPQGGSPCSHGKRLVERIAALLVVAAAVPARADAGDTLLAFSYVIPMGVGAVATAVNGAYLAYDEPAPRHWRWIGWVSGGVDLAWGAGLLAAANDRSEGVVLGSIGLGIGAAAVLTATFVGQESNRLGVVPVAVAHGGGLALLGRF